MPHHFRSTSARGVKLGKLGVEASERLAPTCNRYYHCGQTRKALKEQTLPCALKLAKLFGRNDVSECCRFFCSDPGRFAGPMADQADRWLSGSASKDGIRDLLSGMLSGFVCKVVEYPADTIKAGNQKDHTHEQTTTQTPKHTQPRKHISTHAHKHTRTTRTHTQTQRTKKERKRKERPRKKERTKERKKEKKKERRK